MTVENYVKFFRNTSPYINMHRGKTFVIAISGDGVSHGNFSHIIHDIALLNSLGIAIVLVHGARPQIEQRLRLSNLDSQFHNGQRISNEATMACVKDAIGNTRITIEAMLSLGLVNSPMHGSRLQVVSGNFITAKPVGVRDGIDFHLTGEVRKIDVKGIEQHLAQSSIVLVSSLGYSVSGDVFNLTHENVATELAVALNAEKLIAFTDSDGLRNEQGELVRVMPLHAAEHLMASELGLNKNQCATISAVVNGVTRGVPRGHLINYQKDGALLGELFTRSGQGTLVMRNGGEVVRQATLDDVPGLLEIITPLEEQGILVKRSRELLENEISQFFIMTDAENIVVACAALYPFGEDMTGNIAGTSTPQLQHAELACVATHGDYTKRGYATRLLAHIEREAQQLNIDQLFVLTTHTAHWFVEQGFAAASIEHLPEEKKCLYNYTRNSKIFSKVLTPE